MKTERIETIYSDIATKLDKLIPEKWSEIYLYAQLANSMYTMYFFYYTENKKKLVYSFDIPKNYEINEDEFDDLRDEIKKDFKDLQNEFVVNKQELWTNLTLVIKDTDEFKINYRYNDISTVDPFEQQVIWRYEVLGLDSSNQSNLAKKVLERYIEDKKKS
ncbi:immunity protein YezG family protein [Ruminiclostridium cellobioparum]|uniref:immunity protein YezG family protein n=1 Tax=Ruminiclostridium cellobioparum TaxID=29355 RepID=UPI000487E206|nr:immunity protein YezG family protein [Ruminiclostridium cellobioparum]